MFKRTPYLVIIILLLIQLISCLPRSPSSDSVDFILPGTTTITPSVGENAVPSGHNSFEEAFHKGLINIIKFSLQRSNQIVKDVLADPSMYNIDSEAMKKELSLLRKYVTDSKEVLNKVPPADQFSSNTFFLFVNDARNVYGSFCRYHNFEAELGLTPEEQVTWDALKNGYREFNKELNKLMKEHKINLADEFEVYVKTLSADEKEKDKDMKDMMAAWNAYKNNKISKAYFGKNLHDINLGMYIKS